MKPQILQAILLGLLALNCDLGQTPSQHPSEPVSQTPLIQGHVLSASYFPLFPLHNAEVTISWDSGSASTLTDTVGRFTFQRLPHKVFTLAATATNHDTVTQTVDLTQMDSAAVGMSLTMQTGFIPGQIVVGLKDTVSLDTFVFFADSKGLPIRRAVDFIFLTDSTSTDSIQRIENILSGKPYLTSASFYTMNGKLGVSYFIYLTPDLLLDWQNTYQQFGFQEIPSAGTKFSVLLVEPGTENRWIQDLSGEAIINYLELNGILVVVRPPPPNKRLHLTELAGG